MWAMLRDRKLLASKFRREHQIGEYIVDFYCAELKLVIECDGEPHFTDEGRAYDDQRTRALKKMGMTVMRFENRDIVSNPRLVEEAIKRVVVSLRS
jgi:very-short-patch-repair endonuclease